MIVVLHPEQAREVRALSRELEMDVDTVVRHLLSGPLLTLDEMDQPLTVTDGQP